MRFSSLLFALALGAASSAHAAPMKLDDYLALRGPAPTSKLAYGPAPSQYAELFVPPGAGPFPVAVLVHGGCWNSKFGGIIQFRNMASALAARGIAVWNVEYRRIDEPGGGYPGMYLDMQAALDLLATHAPAHKLDLARISILSLVEQYLAVIEGARRVRLELAADWLVMAAWLTWLKSRLLLPAWHAPPTRPERSACHPPLLHRR